MIFWETRAAMKRPQSSRQRYRSFVEDYRRRRLDDAGQDRQTEAGEPSQEARRKRRQYLREYVRWLRPHGGAVAVLFLLALVAAGMQMAEPLFLRFIVDRVLLNSHLVLLCYKVQIRNGIVAVAVS